jgi:transposase-like protein
MVDIFSAPVFGDDQKARRYLERLRWPDGPLCPRCGTVDRAYEIRHAGVYRCADPKCQANFTVTLNTVLERSHIPLHKWLRAFHLMCSTRNGVSALQLHRTLGITYRSAWFMVQRIRKAMLAGGVDPLGGSIAASARADEHILLRRTTHRSAKREVRAGNRTKRKNS